MNMRTVPLAATVAAALALVGCARTPQCISYDSHGRSLSELACIQIYPRAKQVWVKNGGAGSWLPQPTSYSGRVQEIDGVQIAATGYLMDVVAVPPGEHTCRIRITRRTGQYRRQEWTEIHRVTARPGEWIVFEHNGAGPKDTAGVRDCTVVYRPTACASWREFWAKTGVGLAMPTANPPSERPSPQELVQRAVSGDTRTRMMCLDALTDEADCERVFLNCNDRQTQARAISKISDQARLIRLLASCREPDRRAAIVSRLQDPVLLRRVAADTAEDYQVRIAAVRACRDDLTLKSLAVLPPGPRTDRYPQELAIACEAAANVRDTDWLAGLARLGTPLGQAADLQLAITDPLIRSAMGGLRLQVTCKQVTRTYAQSSASLFKTSLSGVAIKLEVVRDEAAAPPAYVDGTIADTSCESAFPAIIQARSTGLSATPVDGRYVPLPSLANGAGDRLLDAMLLRAELIDVDLNRLISQTRSTMLRTAAKRRQAIRER